MNKPFIKKKFKFDMESDSDTELINKNHNEFQQSEKVLVQYLCDQFDFEKIIAETEFGNLSLEVNSPKQIKKQRNRDFELRSFHQREIRSRL